VEASGKKGKKGKKKGKGKKNKGKGKKTGGGGQAPVCTEGLGSEATCGPPPCDISTCLKGCCQGGQCLSGTSNTACEKRGFACENCAAQGEVCNEFQSCQCEAEACKALGGCCFDERCLVGDPEHCCASEGESCIGQSCCKGMYCHPSSQTCLCRGRGDTCVVVDADDEWRDGHLARPCCNDAPCENGTCSRHCRYWGCSGAFTCCESTGECFHTTRKNCRHPDGSLFFCDANLLCCVSSNNAGCGGGCSEDEGFHVAEPVTCS
jgi:hypothetical protein